MSNDESTECVICGDYYALRSECEPTEFCDLCAQTILYVIAPMVPKPPAAITWEMGNEILTKLQNELWPIQRLQREHDKAEEE